MKSRYYFPVAIFLIVVLVYFSSINLPLVQNNKNNNNTSSKEGFISTSTFNKHRRNLRLASKPYLKMAKKYAPFHFGLLDGV